LGARGKDNKIAPEELAGGTFTISNGRKITKFDTLT